MIVWGLFTCYQMGCWLSNSIPLFRSQEECQQLALQLMPESRPLDERKFVNGRAYYTDSAWYECHSRHVETWQ